MAVVAWGTRADHRQVVVDRSRRERMTAEGMVALRAASVGLEHVLGDVMPIAPASGGFGEIPPRPAIGDAGRCGCVCGALPELRTMAMSLMHRLNVEVEALDSLFAIDPGGSAFERLSAGRAADESRERSAELRVAWAAAADWPALNLLWSFHQRTSRRRLARFAAAAGLAVAGGLAAWALERPARSVSHPPPLVPLTSVSETRAHLVPRRSIDGRDAIGAANGPSGKLSSSEPPLSRGTRGTTAATATSSVPEASASRGSMRPIDARLETILYAPDRAVALIDGQVVQVGDFVRGAKIVEIMPRRVLLRDPQGRVWRLALAPSR